MVVVVASTRFALGFREEIGQVWLIEKLNSLAWCVVYQVLAGGLLEVRLLDCLLGEALLVVELLRFAMARLGKVLGFTEVWGRLDTIFLNIWRGDDLLIYVWWRSTNDHHWWRLEESSLWLEHIFGYHVYRAGHIQVREHFSTIISILRTVMISSNYSSVRSKMKGGLSQMPPHILPITPMLLLLLSAMSGLITNPVITVFLPQHTLSIHSSHPLHALLKIEAMSYQLLILTPLTS